MTGTYVAMFPRWLCCHPARAGATTSTPPSHAKSSTRPRPADPNASVGDRPS